MNLSICGINCDACQFKLDSKCEGCRISAAKGECVWGGRCDTHDCATTKELPHCGKCEHFPCEQLVNIHKSENPDGNGIEIEQLRALDMNFQWVDYNEVYEAKVASWHDEQARFYDVDVLEAHKNFLSDDEYTYGEDYFCKVVLDKGQAIAVIIILRGDDHPTTFSECIVKPNVRGQGYGTRILMELVNHIRTIIGYGTHTFTAQIFPNNAPSIRAFSKAGFVRAGGHADGDCDYWCYPASELATFQTYQAKAIGTDFIPA